MPRKVVVKNRERRRERLDVVRRLYVKEEWGVRAIARYLGCGMSQIRYDLKHLGILTPRQMPLDEVTSRVLEFRLQAKRLDSLRRCLPDFLPPKAVTALRTLLRACWPEMVS